MFKLYKLLFVMTLIISTMISISSQSWLGMWVGLEINLLSFIPLINSQKNMMKAEASIKYFITQAIASTILLFSMIIMSTKLPYNIHPDIMVLIFNSALLTKMGAAPFHFWFPEVIEGLDWFNTLILLTWQKLAPMVLLMYNIHHFYFSVIIVFCMLISGIMGINQISLRKILAYSSINHIGWMIGSMMFIETIWFYYFIVYSLITMNIVFILNNQNTFYLKQLFNSMKSNKIMKLFFILNFMSLGGLPPFIGFFPKWITVQTLIMNNSYLVTLIMIVLTLLTLFFYMRITFSTLLLSSSECKFKMINNSQPEYTIIMFNFITLSGLIYATLMFNLI